MMVLLINNIQFTHSAGTFIYVTKNSHNLHTESENDKQAMMNAAICFCKRGTIVQHMLQDTLSWAGGY